MNDIELKNKLLEVINNELGYYRNNQKSIWVYGSVSQPPSSSDGLECLIKQQPNGVAQAVSGAKKYKPQMWEITLKNYKPSSKLVEAIAKIELEFIVNSCNHIPATNEIFEQARILIFDPIVISR
jgi:aspartate/tyrosine/aromatic aminotransferase